MENYELTISPETLRDEFLFRGRFYKKGFGVLIQGLICELDLLYEDDGEREKRTEWMRSTLQQMRSIYDQMIEEGLKNSPDADLLTPISEKINVLTTEVERVILTNAPVEEAIEMVRFIFHKAQEFRARLTTLQKQLRTCPGFERTRLSGKDIFGKEWTSCL